MHLPISWLKEWIQLELSSEQIAHQLTLLGLEVEGIEYPSLSFSKVIVADILDVKPHPQSEHLQIAHISTGKQTYDVVCGASNCRKGLRVAYAQIGAQVELKKGEISTISPRKVRGVESPGMLCGHDELQLPSFPFGVEDGIMELDTTFEPGQLLASYFGEPVLEIGLTPNLIHCASILGCARELSCALNIPLKSFPKKPFSTKSLPPPCVQVKDLDGAPRYACRIIEGIQLTESPEWLKQRLKECGISSKNIVADITNFVLLERGQPLHAFDWKAFNEQPVTIRRALLGEKIELLNEKTYTLQPHHLVIGTHDEALALAGVMGGAKSAVSAQTTTVLLEAAYFNPQSVRKTAKECGLSTDASFQFERGTNPEDVIEALERATALIVELCGAKQCSEIVDHYPTPFIHKKITCRPERVNQILGTQLSVGEIEQLLKQLNFPLERQTDQAFVLTVPPYRHDINLEIDLVEEVARFYGIENLLSESHCPYYQSSSLPDSPLFSLKQSLSQFFVKEGMQEWITCDLISEKEASLLKKDLSPIRVLNPRSQDQSILRTSLLPSMLSCVKRNFDHQILTLRAFEIGHIHFSSEEGYKEPLTCGLILSGLKNPSFWCTPTQEIDFFDLKGIIERMARFLHLQNFSIRRSNSSLFHPGRQAALWVGEEELGTFGELHPKTLEQSSKEAPVLFAEFILPSFLTELPQLKRMTPLPQFPASTRDWTTSLPVHFPAGELTQLSFDEPYLEKIVLVDVYQHEKLGSGIKNVTYHFVYRGSRHTLSVDEVQKAHAHVVELLTKKIEELKDLL